MNSLAKDVNLSNIIFPYDFSHQYIDDTSGFFEGSRRCIEHKDGLVHSPESRMPEDRETEEFIAPYGLMDVK